MDNQKTGTCAPVKKKKKAGKRNNTSLVIYVRLVLKLPISKTGYGS